MISPNTKKRKLSDPLSGPQKASKSKRSEEICTTPKTLEPKSVDDDDNEVSSSCEPDNEQDQLRERRPSSGKDGKPKVVGLIEKFLRTTQQLEVSTSCAEETEAPEEVVDLTDQEEAESAPQKLPTELEEEKGLEKSKNSKIIDKESTEIKDGKEDEEKEVKGSSTKDTNESQLANGPTDLEGTAEATKNVAADSTDEVDEVEPDAEQEVTEISSPSSHKSNSPENSPKTSIAMKTPSSAKRSRTRVGSKLPILAFSTFSLV